MKIKSRLKLLILNQGIDQKTVAADTGLSPTTIGKIYNNHFKGIDTHTVTTLMQYFNLKNIDDLLEVIVDEAS